ncbi:xanthine dehydrogenase family protein molybdopterin-binding subunit [Novosphingobium pituita]|uniref:Xanthine dehydrogenase family protein molybdopterin-binding subunit n=1 Tax=Novosphingobium pituita TaxID=3056842 RepID=A0ABQ6P3E6_9SPHN|nr:molybdopterin cofactor-binding domain-containing protein [Novosphingobium sp. IK01]GMM59392.1 xanthine dehydrogenase family protein molybdopterin-binding subunit [Novosphingobium sp. IK01]
MSATALSKALARREVLAAGGLLVAFSFSARSLAQLAGGGEGGAAPKAIRPDLPGSLKSNPELDSWISIGPDGQATVFSGKVELGQGIRTALLQVAAEELDLPPSAITFITADTARTPDEGLTAGSHSMQDGGTALANAGANVRMLLTQAAARVWSIEPDQLTTTGDGHVAALDGRRLSYGQLATRLSLHVEAVPDAPRRDPRQYRTMGKNFPRVDIPAKLVGGEAFVQDMRLPGMLHARVVRGPSYGTRLAAPKLAAARAMPGVVAVIENGDFLAVVARKEWQAIKAMRVAQESDYVRLLPPMPAAEGPHHLQTMPSREIVVLDTHDGDRPAWKTVRGSFSRPWYSHGSIGPSCAVALARDGGLTIWSHSQGVFDMHRAIAELVGLAPEKVRCIHTPSAGCYGQNGADDVTAEAGLIAMALPGHPIRLQWMREQEFGWEPCGCGMVTKVDAAIGPDKRIAHWTYEVWSNSHNTRAVKAGGYAVAQQVRPGFAPQEAKPIPMPEGDGDRNANPLYVFPNMNVLYHFVPEMPLRVSALRSLGAHLNVFTIESTLDDLARAGGVDPLAFRLAHMEDERARAVMIEAAGRFGWSHRSRPDGRRGCGMAFARYKNIGAYCAIVMEVEVERETGAIMVHRVNAAVDAGQPASPDGIRNQVEGGIIQSLSWATYEAVTFDATRRTSFDWGTYPIMRFRDVPGAIDVHVMDRPGLPFLGAGETSQGPTSAALANAVADATGVRLRDMPLTPEVVKAAIGLIG